MDDVLDLLGVDGVVGGDGEGAEEVAVGVVQLVVEIVGGGVVGGGGGAPAPAGVARGGIGVGASGGRGRAVGTRGRRHSESVKARERRVRVGF